MKLDFPRYIERIGAVNINSIQKVYELDSGKSEEYHNTYRTIRKINDEELLDIFNKLAIIIPIKDEKLKLLEGVLSGIPHDCLVIIVSNSQRYPIDRFKMECDILQQFTRFVDRDAIIIHQKDPVLADIFRDLEYTSILDGDIVRDGKAEGMIIGMIIAKMLNKEYVGFVDADNYVPGAINEYIKIFGSGILMSQSPYSMIRISWLYKPKIVGKSFYFAKWGRISDVTNRYLNEVISYHTGFETEIIKTANAGEHALSMKLAELLTYSSGYSIEPYEIVNIIEEFGCILPSKYPDVIQKEGVEILQIETQNPHIHEDKGNEHLSRMLKESLSCIYFSKICNKSIRWKIIKELRSAKAITHDQLSPLPTIKPFNTIDIQKFANRIGDSTIRFYGNMERYIKYYTV
ncbi:MAG: mannosyl-3-phosphoglycerate synthase [Candidatus Nitrosocaldaceae archaeon]